MPEVSINIPCTSLRRNNGVQTTYHRQPLPGHDSTKIKCDDTTEKGTVKKTLQSSGDDARSRKLPTFLSQVKIYNGTFSDESIWKLSLRPFPFILSPVVRIDIPIPGGTWNQLTPLYIF